jgi:hypothetical protein
MSRLARSCRALAVGIVAAAATLSMTQVASAAPDPNPSDIVVPAGNRVFLVGHATGVQIYKCDAVPGGGTTWTFVEPRADLFDDNGKLVVKHFRGPTWQATADGSTVTGSVVKKDGVPASVTVDPTAIPWLLLQATVTTQKGVGLLGNTTFIQRVNTTGGRAPTDGCNANVDTREVPYTANYRFWKLVGA